jgi:branched-chain amino acid transport system substrate-binding protein
MTFHSSVRRSQRPRIGRRSRFVAAFAVALAGLAVPLIGAATSTASAATTPAPVACNTAGAPKCYGTSGYPVTNYLSYVGGTKGKANPKLSTIEIGWVNQQGGAADIAPETTIGATVAQDYLNNDAGGIDGHPVKLVDCFIPDTVTNATQCGQEFANDKNISAIAMGAVAIGNQALESAVAPTHKPIVFLISLATVDDSYKPGYALYGDSTHILAPYATFAKDDLHVKRVAVVYEDDPGAALGADIIVDALKYEGIKTTIVGFDPSITDLTTPLEAADVAQSNMVISTVGGSDCSNLYQAMVQLKLAGKVKVGVFGPCASTQVEEADGGKFPPGWYYASANAVYQDPKDPSGPAFYKVTRQFGEAAYAPDPWVTDSFGQILTIAKWETAVLKSGEQITPATVAAQGNKFEGPVPFGAQHLVCGTYKDAPAVCNDKSTLFLDDNGVFNAVARWVGPPPGYVPPAG